MVNFLSNLPIFRRLFIAFAIAAIMPGIVIVLLGNFYLSSLNTRSQAVVTSFNAQSIASQQQANLQTMNSQLLASEYNVFAILGENIHDSSMFASGALLSGDIINREANFQQGLTNYQSNYNLATSDNMSTVRTILMNDNPTGGIIQDQQNALKSVHDRLGNERHHYTAAAPSCCTHKAYKQGRHQCTCKDYWP